MAAKEDEHQNAADKPGQAHDDASPFPEPVSLENQRSPEANEKVTPAPPQQGSSGPGSAGAGQAVGQEEQGVLVADNQNRAPYSVFSGREKGLIVLLVSIASFFSPVSANIYFPA